MNHIAYLKRITKLAVEGLRKEPTDEEKERYMDTVEDQQYKYGEAKIDE